MYSVSEACCIIVKNGTADVNRTDYSKITNLGLNAYCHIVSYYNKKINPNFQRGRSLAIDKVSQRDGGPSPC